MNILIVDDEQSIRETGATVSEQCGMKPVAVATADEALEVLEHSAVDIVLTDLKLQQSNGVELLKRVHDVHPEVAVGGNDCCAGRALAGNREPAGPGMGSAPASRALSGEMSERQSGNSKIETANWGNKNQRT
jgi:hypothetical protein